jgi:hypothetical protein
MTRAAVSAINPHLVPLIAHDRAGFGGALLSFGVAMFCCLRYAHPARALWQALAIAGVAGFGTAVGVHPAIGYLSVAHLGPAMVRCFRVRGRPRIGCFGCACVMRQMSTRSSNRSDSRRRFRRARRGSIGGPLAARDVLERGRDGLRMERVTRIAHAAPAFFGAPTNAAPGSELRIYEAAAHGLPVTHAERLQADLIAHAQTAARS